MNKIRIISDIHGDFDWYMETIAEANFDGLHTLQLGDFAIGFPRQEKWNNYWLEDVDELSTMNKVFFGNHDNPLYAQNSPMFLNRFGYDKETGIFHIGGAYSIDKWARIEGVSWWEKEELSYDEMRECEELYMSVRPKIIVSHDGPINCINWMFPHYAICDDIPTSRTCSFLQHLYEGHQPELWCFGHHHVNIEYNDDYTKTHFKCIADRDYVDINLNTKEII